ncbi:N-acetyltransferase [Ruminococcaceae bacterium OttesenSCG-928-L11]|nr:N-acetyltransferase [Ruminococcaceae bacterium OttesenSCG-928-L11]
MEIVIRNERPSDYRRVEELTRDAFWNLHSPGCDEHYLAHLLRTHADFIPQLDFVAETDGVVTGNIMYTKSWIKGPTGSVWDTITFGPLSVSPGQQGKGIGSALVRHSLARAKELGCAIVWIYGNPAYYSRFGFRSSKEWGITNAEGKYPTALQLMELKAGALSGVSGYAAESEAFEMDAEASARYDALFPPKVKEETPSQRDFRAIAGTYL